MSKEVQSPTREQAKQIEIGFLQTYGKSYRKMKKDELALMIANQSSNYKTMEAQAYKIAELGHIMMKQRDVFKKILRERDSKHKCNRVICRSEVDHEGYHERDGKE